jgi:hypothetical protein
MKKLLLTSVAVLFLATGTAHARNAPAIAIDFVGDWCLADVREDGTLNYRLPSWMGSEPCDRIISISIFDISHNYNNQVCELAKPMRVKAGNAPSGPGYETTITLNCYYGPYQIGDRAHRMLWNFYRYKGNLYINTDVQTSAPPQDRP